MNYTQINPPDSLKNYIRYCWVLKSTGTDPAVKVFRTMADGCPGLLFQPSANGILYKNTDKLPETLLFGQSTKYTILNLAGSFNTLGIYFYPNALQSIFGVNAMELTDSCMDLNLLAEKNDFYLKELLLTTNDSNEQLEILFSYLNFQIRKNNRQVNLPMEYALSSMITSNGNIPLKMIQDYLRLSERSLERKFKEYIGISPKLFSRICRFQASLSQLRNHDYDKFSDIAYGNNYADQSHFIRSFKEFAGFSPFQYQKQAREVVQNLSELI
ncbi:AraC family transcriptional regulator [Pedobacter lusitanus]|uniref:AraC family transcriptional regulator n=1 Tax=Pedobacter lusitanus TaxID=1503925 RepID=A0A0D0GLP1_9SPHI|nr:helix-turn-helix transcriptional regulator [Pedobacter lusitanus]KIO77110.1 AraC family transcriptional regulator [Pedobacter lusitanus]